MTSKYTPGPWLVCEGAYDNGIEVGPEDGFLVFGACGCCGSPWINSHVDYESGHIEAATANARLIAAAPDLYEALELLLKASYDGGEMTPVERLSAKRFARAALKLAKGE